MGTGTNQIATRRDLYYSGYTDFSSSASSASGAIGVTYWDFEQTTGISKQTGINGFRIEPSSTLSGSVNLSNSNNYTVILAEYDISEMGVLNDVMMPSVYDATISVSVKNNSSSTSISARLCLYIDDTEYQHSTTSISAGSTTTLNGCLCSVITDLKNDSSSDEFNGATTVKWGLKISTASSSVWSATVSNVSASGMRYGSKTQLIKYSDVGGPNNPVNVTWTVVISEGVTGATRANKILFRYQQLSSNGSGTATIQTQELGLWDYGANINTSASGTVTFNINPYDIKKNFTGYPYVHGSWLEVLCGKTNKTQTWKYRLRYKSTNTWTDWMDPNAYLAMGAAPSIDYDCVAYVGNGYTVAWDSLTNNETPSYTDQQFLADVSSYNGIEFNVK